MWHDYCGYPNSYYQSSRNPFVPILIPIPVLDAVPVVDASLVVSLELAGSGYSVTVVDLKDGPVWPSAAHQMDKLGAKV